MNQPAFILPNGTHVRTHPHLGDTRGMENVNDHNLRRRRGNAPGVVLYPVPGMGGDVYWVQHGEGDTAPYCFTEFELVESATPLASAPDDGETGLRLNPVRVRIAAEVVSVREARGCNDWEWPAYVPKAERLSLIHDYHAWNGDPEEAVGRTSIGLSSVKAYLLAALLKHARETVTR